MDFRYIVIEGNIGAGKTTLSTKLAEEYNAKLILEQYADNPFLPKFYSNPEKYSFPLEMSFLAERYEQLRNELEDRDLFKSFALADYYFMKSLIFSQSTLTEDEYQLYRQIFNIIYKTLPKPDLYIYLHVNVENLISNIKKRGRDYEQSISADYLKNIQDSYFSYFKQLNDIKCVVIDTNNIDFVNSASDYEKIKDIIFNRKYEPGINRVVI